MTILALEFSSERRSVAVARDGAILAEAVHQGTQGTPIFALITDALAAAGVTRNAVEVVAVGLGPGSYTGVRLAISVAQGWQLANGVKTVGINSLENLACVAAIHTPDLIAPECLLAVDAQRDEFAVAPARAGRLTGPVRLMSAPELRERLARGEVIAGPEVVPLLGGGCPLHPSAAITAQLAAAAIEFPAAETLVPVYLREASFVKAPKPRDVNLAT